MPEELMEHEDKDKDGSVSWDEFSGPKGDKAPEVTQWSNIVFNIYFITPFNTNAR